MKSEQLVNGIVTTTVGTALTSGATSLSVTSSSGFPTDGNFRVRIEAEILKVTAVSGTTWTVERGQEGTTAAAHSTGTIVNFYLTRGTLHELQRDMYNVGTWAERPVVGKTNGLYFTSNSNYLSRYNGTAWEDMGPIFKINPPPANFNTLYTWYQQNTATLTRIGMSWVMKVPTGDTAGQVRMICKTAPSTPYTIEAGFRFLTRDLNYNGGGLVLRQSSDNKHMEFGMCYHTNFGQGFHAMVDKYWTNGAFDSTYRNIQTSPRYSALNYPEFFRIVDDGTNRTFQWSQDGRNWETYGVVGRTDFLTANQVGFGVQTSNSNEAHLEIFHYKEY